MNAITSLKSRKSRHFAEKRTQIDDDASSGTGSSSPLDLSVHAPRTKRGSLKERLAKGASHFNDIFLAENQDFNFPVLQLKNTQSENCQDFSAADRFFSPQRKRINSCNGKNTNSPALGIAASGGCAIVDRSVDPASSKLDDYQKKYKTEICKNFEFRGFCQWGDAVC